MVFALSEEIWGARSCWGGVWAMQQAGGGEEEGAMLGGVPWGWLLFVVELSPLPTIKKDVNWKGTALLVKTLCIYI